MQGWTAQWLAWKDKFTNNFLPPHLINSSCTLQASISSWSSSSFCDAIYISSLPHSLFLTTFLYSLFLLSIYADNLTVYVSFSSVSRGILREVAGTISKIFLLFISQRLHALIHHFFPSFYVSQLTFLPVIHSLLATF